MIFILQSDLFKKVLSSKFIVNIGNLSLDIYLYHWTIINTISMFIVLKVLTYTKYYIAVLISLLISTVILLIISKLSNKYIQKYTSLFSNKIVNAVMNIN
jgi:peptidoglycan/LPS O-acetylase OafA/YrhL